MGWGSGGGGGGGTGAVSSVAGRIGDIVLAKTDVGLANVDNVADASKPVSTAQQTALNLKSIALTDNGSVTTASTLTAVANKIHRLDTTSNAITVTLPTAPATGTQILLKVVAPNPLVNFVTWVTGGSDVVNVVGGATTAQLKVVGQAALFQYIGSNIWTLSLTDIPLTQLDLRFGALADVTSLATIAAMHTAQINASLSGASVVSGGLLSASATAGKIDCAAGLDFITPNRVTVAAQTAVACVSNADATNPRWLVYEVDSTGTVQVNVGTAAASPVIPDATAGRVVHGLVYLPANATAVDGLLTTANGKAKLIDLRVIQPIGLGASLDGWLSDAATWVYGSATVFAVAGNATGYLPVGTKVSYNDGAVDYGVIGTELFYPASPVTGVTATVATSLFTKTSHGLVNDFPITPTGLTNATGITNGRIYWVVSSTANTFQLATTIGGAAVTLGGTDDGAVITMTGATSIGLLGNNNYSIANATLSAPRYSYLALPLAFPTSFAYTPTLAGWSANPTTVVYLWSTNGRTITIYVKQGANGTSNSATHTMTTPTILAGNLAAATLTNMEWMGPAQAVDNGVTGSGSLGILSAGTTISMYGLATKTNTGSGSARIIAGQITFQF